MITQMPVSTEDYLAIADLLGRYCWRLDAGDGDGWADLWTDDGFIAGVGPDSVSGRATLREVPISIMQRCGGAEVHRTANLCCDYGETRDTINASFYNDVSTWLPSGPGKPLLFARCEMTVSRAATGWRITRITFDPLPGE